MAIDSLTTIPYNTPLINFSPLVVTLRMDGFENCADNVQYLINRCERLENAIINHHNHVAGYSEINQIAEEIIRGRK